MENLSDIGEDALIARLLKQVPISGKGIIIGSGDDCAVTEYSKTHYELLKTDAVIEGVHFLPEENPTRVGWKAIARVISDFAAMGGRPKWFMVTIAIPTSCSVRYLENLYTGMGKCMETHGGILVGGETTRIPPGSSLMISIAATGEVKHDELVLRSEGKVDDSIYVTGKLGGSISGKHLDFQPRIDQASWLVKNFKPNAMMDLSDGLAKDLPRLAKASSCGLILEKNNIPGSLNCNLDQALNNGEDYELLFTVDVNRSEKLENEWRKKFPKLLLTKIGSLVNKQIGESLNGGWDHFL
jgi:thiamine-monophosphate kinase